MLLAVDAGNSFVKLGWYDGAWREVERVPLAAFGSWVEETVAQPMPRAVVIANVAGERFRAPMERLLAGWRCRVLWVRPAAQGYGIVNRYRRPDQLGADRWCALVAAQKARGAKLVVDVGTAVTVDALTAAGVFEGGVILPGPALIRTSLAANTVQLAAEPGEYEMFPRETANAIMTGALLAIAGTVDRMAETLAQQAGEVEIWLTGGGAPPLLPLLRPPVRHVPHLVLEGLLSIARAEGLT